MLKNGRADGDAKPTLRTERGAVCLIDNHDALPYEACAWAIEEVIVRARRNGIGFAGITNSGHVGVLGVHLLALGEAGLVGFAFTNSPAAIPAWGGRKALFGTDPVAAVFPRPAGDPLVIDLALTTVIRGKIMLAAQRGERIPEGWALDRDGKPTTDPKAALAGGVVLPIGEHKGSGISMFMDIFGGVISGANFGGEVGDQYKALDRAQDVGHFFLAMKPNLFVSEDEYRARIDALIERVQAAPKADGFAEILLPGEPEDRIETDRRKGGIPYAASEVAALQDEAKKAGVQPLVVSDQPIA